MALSHATGHEDALAKAFALGSPADIATVWVDGEPLGAGHGSPPV